MNFGLGLPRSSKHDRQIEDLSHAVADLEDRVRLLERRPTPIRPLSTEGDEIR